MKRREPRLDQETLAENADGLVCLSGCARLGLAVHNPNGAARLAQALGPERFFVELQRPLSRGDARRNNALRDLAAALGLRTVVTGNAHAHDPSRVQLQDVLVAIKSRTSLEGCEPDRRGNDECALLSPAEVVARWPNDRDALNTTVELAERLEFDLTQELGYGYPDFSDGPDPAAVQLHRVCAAAFGERYPKQEPGRPRPASAEELALIEELGLSGFFLLHWEVLELAREVAAEVRGPGSPRHLLPPGRGRGSSVGSIVCYLTGLSHVDPVATDLKLGRFLNRELASVPDIDLDFPRDIREKLIVERLRALRARALGARRELRHLPVARRDPRRRQGARPAAGGARAHRAHLERLGRAPHRRGARAAPRRGAPRPLAALEARFASCAPRSPACRATSPSTRAAWSSRAGRSRSSSRSSRPRWRAGRCASGTRTRARTPVS